MLKLNKCGRQTRKSGTIAERVRKVRDTEIPLERLLRKQNDRERNMLRLSLNSLVQRDAPSRNAKSHSDSLEKRYVYREKSPPERYG